MGKPIANAITFPQPFQIQKRFLRDTRTSPISFAFSLLRGGLKGVADEADFVCSEFPACDRPSVLKEITLYHLAVIDVGLRSMAERRETSFTRAYEVVFVAMCHAAGDPTLPAEAPGKVIAEVGKEMETLRQTDPEMFRFIREDLNHVWRVENWDDRYQTYLRAIQEAPRITGVLESFNHRDLTNLSNEERLHFHDLLRETEIVGSVGVGRAMLGYLGVDPTSDFAFVLSVIANSLQKEAVSHLLRFTIT